MAVQSDFVNVQVNNIYCINPSAYPDDSSIRKTLLATYPQVNGFKLVAGREPGYGYFLLLGSDVLSIQSDTSIEVKITQNNSTITITQLVLTETRRLYPTNNNNDLVVVKLEDYRYLAKRHSNFLLPEAFPPHVQFVPDPDPHESNNLDALKALWDETEIQVASGSVDWTDADEPSILLRDVPGDDINCWGQLNDVLDLISHKVYKTPSGFSVRANSTTDTINQALVAANQKRLTLKRGTDAPPTPQLPADIDFHYREINNDNTNSFKTYNEVYGGAETDFTGVTKGIMVYNKFDPNHADEATYDTDLDTLSGELADLYYNSFDNHLLYNAIYFGVLGFEANPSAVEIEYFHDVQDNKYKTRIKSLDMGMAFFPEIESTGGGSSFQILKTGIADSDIAINDSGDVSIWLDGSDTGDNVTGWHNWLGQDEQISAGKRCIVGYFEDEDKWRIIGVDCEDPPEPDTQTDPTVTLVSGVATGFQKLDASSNAIALTLPNPSGNENLSYDLLKIDSSANDITVDVDGGATINGETDLIIDVQFTCITVFCDGTEYFIR